MFSRFVQLLLTITSISPVLLIFWFKEFSKNWDIRGGVYFLLGAIILISLLWLLIKIAKIKLESVPVEILTVSNADNKCMAFMFLYILPLMGIDIYAVMFLLFVFFAMILINNSYYLNPILRLFGYHCYDVMIGSVSYVLITKKVLRNTKQVNNVVLLSDYIILEKD